MNAISEEQIARDWTRVGAMFNVVPATQTPDTLSKYGKGSPLPLRSRLTTRRPHRPCGNEQYHGEPAHAKCAHRWTITIGLI
jgi:hypothetical protein